ncbi:MAG: ATP-binding protein [Planctomycetota bacterium]
MTVLLDLRELPREPHTMASEPSELQRLEEELRRSEEKYRFFFHNDPNPILVFDAETTRILDANDRAVAEYRSSRERLLARPFLDLTHPSHQARVWAFLSSAQSFLAKVRQIRDDGEIFFVNMRASYGTYRGAQAVIATTADVTERVKQEQQVLQSAKLATLGEMSAGIAHELNQPLSVIGTACHFLLKQVDRGLTPDSQTLAGLAREMVAQVGRASRIIGHLREFGRKAEVELAPIDINDPIRGVFLLLGQQLRVHGIGVESDLPADLPRIHGDANRLEQVFINLVLNARDAIETRRSRDAGWRGGKIAIRSFREGDQVAVTVNDDGVGIPAGDLDRIFEPFFTTKEPGKGTGLGLSISYGIVRDLGGRIEVESMPGEGATFKLSFVAVGAT